MVNSARFWFRQKYQLAPTDPRFLAMTDEAVAVEMEATMAFNGEPEKTCPVCAAQTYMRKCPVCFVELTGDQQMDDVLRRINAGEDVDLDKALRGGFEPVPS